MKLQKNRTKPMTDKEIKTFKSNIKHNIHKITDQLFLIDYYVIIYKNS